MIATFLRRLTGRWLLVAALAITTVVYWPGLDGGWLFDDFPNIVDNHNVQPVDASIPSLVRAALSSPSSEFKRPLASLTFAANYLADGLDPFWWKFTNVLIHLLNGLLVFLLARALLWLDAMPSLPNPFPHPGERDKERKRDAVVAALVAAGWLLLPINLTAVLYVVQRMESMANLFVLLGLLGYVTGRSRMHGLSIATTLTVSPVRGGWLRWNHLSPSSSGFILCVASITVPVALGLLAKETAVMLPLYALIVEWVLFEFRKPWNTHASLPEDATENPQADRRIIGLFLLVLALPLAIGLAWLLPGLLKPESWATRDFTLGMRLLSEARIVVDYIAWTLLPTPAALSFYHDDFQASTGWLSPWSTLACTLLLGTLVALIFLLRRRRRLAAIGIALFLGCQLLTGTILPLELIYEHRNYFASFGLLLAIVPLLAAPFRASGDRAAAVDIADGSGHIPMLRRSCHLLLAGLLVCWSTLTAFTAYAWGEPLRLAEDLASRAPESPRAQYELGRTCIIYSHYDPTSPFTRLAYVPLEKSAALPGSSILPEQALIFMNARMQLPLKDAWWDSLIAKLRARKSGVQDESSLAALTQCAREKRCTLPRDRMIVAFSAALSHPHPSARLQATYSDYAWNVLGDHALGERMAEAAVKTDPAEPAYLITLVRMLAAQGRKDEARKMVTRLESLNVAGSLNNSLPALRLLVAGS